MGIPVSEILRRALAGGCTRSGCAAALLSVLPGAPRHGARSRGCHSPGSIEGHRQSPRPFGHNRPVAGVITVALQNTNLVVYGEIKRGHRAFHSTAGYPDRHVGNRGGTEIRREQTRAVEAAERPGGTSSAMALRLERTFAADRKQLLDLQTNSERDRLIDTDRAVTVGRAYVPDFLTIKAKQISEWAATIDARNHLPVLL